MEEPKKESIVSQFRIDRDFAKNPTVFREFGDDERLTKSLMAYFFLQFKRGNFDLFNKLRLDPYKFGDEMNYKRAELFRKVESPVQLENKSTKEVARLRENEMSIFETKLENALYKMMSRNLVFSSAVGETTTHFVQRTGSQQIIKFVDIYTDKSNKGKKYYDITINNEFLGLLNRYFVNIDKNAFIVSRDANLSDLYFYLVDVQQYCLGKEIKTYDQVTFDFLCDLADISPNYEPADKKKYLKKKFETVTSKVPELALRLEFVTNGRFKYKPIIVCEKSQLESKETRTERAKFLNNDKVEYCVNEIKIGWKDVFASKFPEYATSPEYFQLKFDDWLSVNMDGYDKSKVILASMKKYFPKSEFVQKVDGKDLTLFSRDFERLFKHIIDNNDLPRTGLF